MKKAGVWRKTCAPIIHDVLMKTVGKTEQEISAALFDAYPFGERKYYPYTVWLDEIKKQRKQSRPTKPDGNQPNLF